MPQVEDFKTLRKLATVVLKKKKFHLNADYIKRLMFEFEEIEKQGAGSYWVRAFNEGKKWDHNDNGLLFPYLLKMTKIDPFSEWTYECYPDGEDADIVCFEDEKGKKVEIPAECLVKTQRGIIKAAELSIGDELL